MAKKIGKIEGSMILKTGVKSQLPPLNFNDPICQKLLSTSEKKFKSDKIEKLK
jgi:hypothetical protein